MFLLIFLKDAEESGIELIIAEQVCNVLYNFMTNKSFLFISYIEAYMLARLSLIFWTSNSFSQNKYRFNCEKSYVLQIFVKSDNIYPYCKLFEVFHIIKMCKNVKKKKKKNPLNFLSFRQILLAFSQTSLKLKKKYCRVEISKFSKCGPVKDDRKLYFLHF